jgi:hypothetical protein
MTMTMLVGRQRHEREQGACKWRRPPCLPLTPCVRRVSEREEGREREGRSDREGARYIGVCSSLLRLRRCVVVVDLIY